MQKRSFIWALVIFLTFALVVTGCGPKEQPQNQQSQEESKQEGEPAGDGSWERVQKAGKIVAGLDDAYPPMGFRDEKGQLIGFDIDMAKEISKRIGVEIEWMPTEWNSVVASLLSKKFDVIISGMNMFKERREVVNFAGPYGVASQVILVKVDNNEPIETLDDLKGKVIGTQLGSTGEKEARAAGFTDNNLKLYDKFPQAFTDLDNGRVEAIIIDGFAAPEWIKTGKYKKVGQDIGVNEDDNIGIAVRKEYKEHLDKLNESIESMKADGTLREISMKWIGYDITEGLD
ncbi:MAG: transporter substrate-binding domain-containing protein [Clostridia bacterium]|nr:transporter substrate-binding domain-containing protein [Clostridia bacterium]